MSDQHAQTAPGFPGFELVSNGTVRPSGSGTFAVAVVPEPTSLSLSLIGLTILLGGAWARRRGANEDAIDAGHTRTARSSVSVNGSKEEAIGCVVLSRSS